MEQKRFTEKSTAELRKMLRSVKVSKPRRQKVYAELVRRRLDRSR